MSEQHRSFPNAIEATLLIVALFLTEIGIGEILSSVDALAGVNPLDLWALISVAGNGLLFSVLLAYKKMRHRDLFHAARHSVAATLAVLTIPILLLVPGLALVTMTINSIVTKAFPMSSEEVALFEAMQTHAPIALLFACVIAPMLEEMLFRGVILRSFLVQYSRTAAILGSAALFGVAHLNLSQFVTAFIAGVVLGWLYERTRSLWPCILLHAANNAFAMYSPALIDPKAGDFSTPFYIAAYGCLIVGTLLLLRILMPPRR